MRIREIRINDLREPVLDSRPRISWKTEADHPGEEQRAWRIEVCSEEEEPVWDSGWIESREQLYADYEGPLLPLKRYAVHIWAESTAGSVCRSEAAWFGTAKLDQPWQGKWITAAFFREKGEKAKGAGYLRREFVCQKDVKRACLVICGLGNFEALLNGKRCAEEYLPTPYTDFSKRVLYRVFDVTKLLQDGKNALAVILGNGFYHVTTPDPWQSSCAVWNDVPKLICELHLTDSEGKETVLISDDSWKTARGPIVFNAMRHGEHYDAGLFQDGWDFGGFDETGWENASYVRAPGGRLKAAELEPIRRLQVRKPVKKWKTQDGWVFDAGQAQSGIADIRFGGKAGDTIRVRYSDILYEDGRLNQEALSGFNREEPFHTDLYTKRSDLPERWHPLFCYHGFQYLEISGNEWEPALSDVEIWSLGNAIQERGQFLCSDETVNRIQQLCCNSTSSMYFHVMASDTAREQLSWTGDTGLSCEQMLLNYAPEAFLKKWQQDLRDTQLESGTMPCIVPTAGWGYNGLNGPDWCNPIYEIPMQIYRYSGDKALLRENFSALMKYLGYLETMAVDGILSYGLGDWCAPFEGPALAVNMRNAKCPVAVSDTVFYYSALKAAQRCADILGEERAARQCGKRAYLVKQAFRNRFFDRETFTVSGDCQTSTALMLYHGLAGQEEEEGLVLRLLEQIHRDQDHLDFGILGMKAVCNVLGRYGHSALVLRMLTQKDYPSMKYWIDQGATTLWECWNGGGSHNHHMFSDVSAFFYKYIAGIAPMEHTEGFKEILFRPGINSGLDGAQAKVDTCRGTVFCGWKKAGEKFVIDLMIPAGATGILLLPEAGKDSSRTQQACRLKSGQHHMIV